MNLEVMIEHLQEMGKVSFREGNVTKAIKELYKKGYKVEFDSGNDCLVLVEKMANQENLIRKTIYVPQFVDEWIVKESIKRGISQSNVISLTLQEVMKQEKAIASISSIDRLISELEKLKKAD